ncbi:MAG: 5-nucleotidase [Devosia sp.]|uniref:bifunctional metallophosphatase/5'-nucleotidase n=1 Tax=Devosia sp. TaxID=1871048 RepID=UPI002609A933|nr:bifunctional metallophosphatase/5'-nucleotidase [Devosia sp.]MDB5542148.1 5-nucleotidase [Devosia sp.]
MKRFLFCASALALTAGFSGAAYADFSLTILHINDFHSRFESITASDSTCNAEGETKGECFGGIARLKTEIDAQRAAAKAAGENVVLLSAGDEFQGSLFYTQYKSKIVADFMNDMGFDVVATGNHEFDDGPAEFARFIAAAKFPIIGGNFDSTKDADLKGLPPGVIVLTVDGEKIGVVGATTEDTPEIASPGPNVAFQDVADYVGGAVAALEGAGINKIIVLSHIGYTVDQELAKAVPGIDIIVGGHSHTYLSSTDEKAAGPYPTLVKNPDGVDVPIVQAGSYGKYLGDIKVTWDDAGKLISAKGAPIVLDASVKPDQGFIDRVAELGKPLEALKSEVIGTAAAPIEGNRDVCRVMECSMGNLVADAQLDRVADQGVTISIANSGGLRASIDQGEITMGEVLTVLPFSNTLATFQITGADLVASLENGLSQIEDVAGRFPQVAGLKYTFDKSKPAGSRLVGDVLVKDGNNWVPIDPAKTYGVVTNNYVRGGGDGYALFGSNAVNAYDFGPPLEKVVADYIAKQGGTYTPYTDGRITDASPAPAPEPAAAEPAPAAPAATEAPAATPAAPATTEAPAATPAAPATTPAAPAETPAMQAPAMEAPAMEAPAMQAPAAQ